MSQWHLHIADGGAASKHVGGEAMTHRMRVNPLGDTCLARDLSQDPTDAFARELRPLAFRVTARKQLRAGRTRAVQEIIAAGRAASRT
jgi:hypothetical protein